MRTAHVVAACLALSACKGIPELTFLDGPGDDGGLGPPDGGANVAMPGTPGGSPGTPGGSLGDAALGPRACRCGEPTCGTCPTEAMVVMPDARFRIDGSEVTAEAYDAFLRAPVALQTVTMIPPQCAWNDSYARGGAAGKKPAVQVDWCDAWAFCAWAGKRLCGRSADGGNVALGELTDPAKDEWYHACSQNRPPPSYPYGALLAVDKCNGKGGGGGGPGGGDKIADAMKSPECRGSGPPFSSVYDMSGNAAEWQNACAGDGPSDACRVRGGSYQTEDPACHAVGDARPRNTRSDQVGFRCCAAL